MNQTPQNQPPAGTGPTPVDRLTPPLPPTYPVPGQPHVQYQSGNYTPFAPPVPGPPPPTVSQRLAKAAENGLIGKILAGIGVAITLSGIVMLLVLAAQAGLLRPELRVAGGAVLAAGLVGLGIWVGRTPQRRPGAVALVATGIAGLLFDVLAAGAFYHWLPGVAALAVAGLVAGVGLGVAHRWNSQTLTLMVSIPMLILAPVVTGGVDETLVGSMLIYAAVTLWVQVGRNWLSVFIVNTAAVMIPSLIFALTSDDAWLASGFGLAGIAIAVGSSVLLVRSTGIPEIIAVTSAFAAIPLMFGAQRIDVVASAALVIGALAYLAAAFTTTRFVNRGVRSIWLVAAVVQLLAALGYLLDADYRPSGFIVVGLLLAVAAPAARDLALPVRISGTSFTGIGILVMIGDGAARLLFADHLLPTDASHTSLLIGSLMGLAATGLITWSWADSYPAAAHRLTVAGGMVGLWLVSTAVLSIAHLITDDAAAAFRAGHSTATIVWGVTAAAALLWARRLDGADRATVLSAGLAVMAAAVAKLFLFDLSALDGVFRVLAFIVVGLILLGLGVAYAQKLTDHDTTAPAA
ncbi:DUF2339 domain-containing protein [Gordonia humi]|uniref:DUF2339 domain-containing protein n=1 Tax=Gordonia humi TaxID=686429 RepID=A0A840EQ50_9ACTN|nr:DUF2339 domain-containing protein [Gordonia humi]MBB4133611.1 hypothetical protein [Gordonia humi]